ncbi:hypothetical protein HY631_02370 [Candidatus Uhrbacteria bacterium]|nr:hypothetical protein [Candidatus Uhrbacteria bacterium]
MLDVRKELILKLLIEEYIRTAEPVGSKNLNDRFELGVSPATVRNEMAALEREGFLVAPHTSSGRVPTEKAYVYYLKHLVEKKDAEGDKGLPVPEVDDTQTALKSVAKTLGEVSGETAILAFNDEWSYYSGVANLFHKPDFQNLALILELSDVVDQFDERLMGLLARVMQEPHVWIGSENPFGSQMATVVVRYQVQSGEEGFVGVTGPLRMNYRRNLALVESARNVIETL